VVSENYNKLLAEIGNLQSIIKERRDKREPFLGSFADALESVIKKAKEWFDLESKLASREISILEGIFPEQSYEEKKQNLERYKKEFNEVTLEFNKTIESIRKGKVRSLKDFINKGGVFQLVDPQFLANSKKMFEVCLSLEELIDSLEDGAKYVSTALRVADIVIKGQKKG
jgi:hypothetical protein